MRIIGELVALSTALIWTISNVFYRKAWFAATPFQVNLVRFATSAIAAIGCSLVLDRFHALCSLSRLTILAALLSGFALFSGDFFCMFSLKCLGMVKTLSITFVYPLFNVVIAVLLKGEEATLFVVIEAISVVAGIWLASWNERDDSTEPSRTTFSNGVIAAFVAALIASVNITLLNSAVTLAKTAGIEGLFCIVTVRLVAAIVVSMALSPVFDKNLGWLRVPRNTWIVATIGGMIRLVLDPFLLGFSFLYTQEARAVPISSVAPLFSVIAGVLFLHEPVTRRTILGSSIVASGTFLLFI